MPSAQAIRAGAAYIELTTRDSKLVKGLRAASQKLQAFGASVRATGMKIFAGGAAAITPLLAATQQFASRSERLQRVAARIGTTTEALSELGFAATQTGVEVDLLEEGLTEMVQRLGEAAKSKTGSAFDMLTLMGMSAEELVRMKPEEALGRIADAINQLPTAGERAFAIDEIFGGEGREMINLLQQGSAGMDALRQKARDFGQSISGQDASAAAALAAAWRDVRSAFSAAVLAVGSALAPMLTELLTTAAKVIVVVVHWIKDNKLLVVTIFKIAAAVVAAGVGLIILGTVISSIGAAIAGLVAIVGAVGTAIAIVGKIIALLLTPIGLVVVAVVALGGYLLYATGLGGKALAWLGERFQVLKDDALAAWKGISDALAAGDIGLAAKILWLTLKMEWKRGIHFLNGLWSKAKTFFLTLWTDAVYGLAKIINDAWAGIEVAWAETVGFLADAWSVFTNLLTKSWHTTVGFIKKAWVRLKSLFDEDVNVDAEVNRINRETSEANATADNKMLEAVGRRDQERRERRAQIERDRAGAEETLTQMQQEEHARRQRGFAEDLAGTESELADARREWQEAIAEAAKKRAEAQSGEPERLKELQDDLSFSGSALGEEERKVEVKGTFNALAARGLGADSLAERTARAAEQIVVNTKDLLDEAKQGKLVFAQ